MFSLGSMLNKKRSGQGDESRQRKRSEAHWSLVEKCSTTNLALNKFFLKIIRALSIMHAGNPRPTIDYEPGGIWIKVPFSTSYLTQASNGPYAKKVRGKPRTRSLQSLANPQVFPFRKLPRFWASAHARWKNKFAISSKPIASAASVRPREGTGKSCYEDPCLKP